MSQRKLACIVGARPNFMKMAPLLRALESYPDINPVLIHTGQHYDASLSEVFFEELEMKRPDISLEVGSGSHGVQTARILERVEQVFVDARTAGEPFERVVVVGDVNSTMAATLAAAKLGIPVAHVEAGLRSFDRRMPEEVNRIVTDSLADMLLVSEPAGVQHLLQEGHSQEQVHLVGNVMIDTLLSLLPKAQAGIALQEYDLVAGEYGVVTLHRPSNVDDQKTLQGLIEVLIATSERLPLVFPVHPRTQARLEEFGLLAKLEQAQRITLLGPLGYLDFLELTSQSKVIVTDSGGLQEESTALGIPCLTMRKNTERPITVEEGTSTLIGNNSSLLSQELQNVLTGTYKSGKCPDLWDGQASSRITELLANG